ncbi:hypothetical protein KL919_002447 [Ogataea angusta]|nr:hypothetical protein KL943_003075 [Ogataea angusta]KAG7848202.1 hypothetical protein KL941_002381 [Ogataea angusta]KAG7859742.1 hypothetical protein KL919_002447 [Ogataea angusta]
MTGPHNIPCWDYGTCANGSQHGIVAVAQPEVVQNYLFPISDMLANKILTYRESVNKLMDADTTAEKHKLLIIAGPSTITSPIQSKFCAQWISKLCGKRLYNAVVPSGDKIPTELADTLQDIYSEELDCSGSVMLAMRANFTDYDQGPGPVRQSKEVMYGLPLYRTLMHELAKFCPLTVSLSNTISPQYFSDLCCLGLVDSSLLESQLHRELVSGVSYPCGFQITECDNYKIGKGVEAMYASSFPHSFLTITKNGSVAQVETTGNQDTFLVLQMADDIADSEFFKLLAAADEDGANGSRLRVVVDVGKLHLENYKRKTALVLQLIQTQRYYSRLLGFIVDSGNVYLPEEAQLEEINPMVYDRQESVQYSNLGQKLINKSDKPAAEIQSEDYVHFILAHSLIRTIVGVNS